MQQRAAAKMSTTLIFVGAVVLGCGVMFSLKNKTLDYGNPPEKTVQDYIGEGQKYLDRGDYNEAIVSYDKVLEIENDNLDAIVGLAKVYQNNLSYEDSENSYKRALELDGENPEIVLSLFRLYIMENKQEEAKKLLEEKLILQDPEITRMYEKTKVSEPKFSLPSGSYDSYQKLTCSEKPEDCLIYYTTDGSEPTINSGNVMNEDGVVISDPEIHVKAKAFNGLGYGSDTVSLDYIVTVPVQKVSISDYKIRNILSQAISGKNNNNSDIYNYQLAKIDSLYLIGDESWDYQSWSSALFSNRGYILQNEKNSINKEGSYSNLSFLQYCTNLNELAIAWQKNVDLVQIAALPNLKRLSLVHDNLTDITPLSQCTGLKQLALGWNDLEDISPLAGLTELETLGLWDNKIKDITPVSGLKKLNMLDFSTNQVSDAASLSGLSNLRELWMYENQISDLSFTDSMEELNVLMASDNPITDYGNIVNRAHDFNRIDLKEE